MFLPVAAGKSIAMSATHREQAALVGAERFSKDTFSGVACDSNSLLRHVCFRHPAVSGRSRSPARACLRSSARSLSSRFLAWRFTNILDHRAAGTHKAMIVRAADFVSSTHRTYPVEEDIA